MPYITSHFQPRTVTDRPTPFPKASKNILFVSQFVEIPKDVVFTVEYSVRAAQTAVYSYLNIPSERIPKVHNYYTPKYLALAAYTSFRGGRGPIATRGTKKCGLVKLAVVGAIGRR